jgi:hypothetical protein
MQSTNVLLAQARIYTNPGNVFHVQMIKIRVDRQQCSAGNLGGRRNPDIIFSHTAAIRFAEVINFRIGLQNTR